VLVSGGKGGESELNLNSVVACAEMYDECMTQKRAAIQAKALNTCKALVFLAIGMMLVCKTCV